MGDRLRQINDLSISPSHPGQLSLLPSVGREMSTIQSVVMLCGWGVKAGMVHCTCGKTCGWQVKLCNPSLTHAIPELCSWDGRLFWHNRYGTKIGAVPLLGELVPHVTQCGMGRGVASYKMAFWSIQLFGHNRHGSRPTRMPSFILIHPTVWPQYSNVTDGTGQTTVW